MREIRFRGYGVKSKVMVDVAELIWTVGGLRAHGPGCYIEGSFMDGDEVHDDNIILMQYTGLKDKNGKEIYEGDICTLTRKKYPMMNGTYPVVFKNGSLVLDETGMYFWDYGCKEDDEAEIEVIGNIYENPELLKP